MRHENIQDTRDKGKLRNRERKIPESCGINISDIDPRPIGNGGNHKVFRFKNADKVVKIPINRHIGTVSSAAEEANNIALYAQYFPEFSAPTTYPEVIV
ncbi:MAG: hypothetical protein KGJ07_00900 [Patescibacteria group bacterium]|nr:hypothetical protein [Patescibacteria group bacterium]MDE2588575.1 hypothetical protein [Patescibacteria group bacterium]